MKFCRFPTIEEEFAEFGYRADLMKRAGLTDEDVGPYYFKPAWCPRSLWDDITEWMKEHPR
jgi:hypothetical protein